MARERALKLSTLLTSAYAGKTFPLIAIQKPAEMATRVKHVLGSSMLLVMVESRTSLPGTAVSKPQQIDLHVSMSKCALCVKALWGKARSCIADSHVEIYEFDKLHGVGIIPSRLGLLKLSLSSRNGFWLPRYSILSDISSFLFLFLLNFPNGIVYANHLSAKVRLTMFGVLGAANSISCDKQ